MRRGRNGPVLRWREFWHTGNRDRMLLSVVVPVFNEESYLPETLSHLHRAISMCRSTVGLIVIDNASVDRTSQVAQSFGATVAHETTHNISRVRNTGADVASGDVLVFVDADTIVPAD